MAEREEVIKVMRMKGPVIPVHIAKAFETSILFASAMLSDLVSAKLAKVSRVKIGGSPIYYLPEQRSRLQEFSKHLPGKEKEAYEILKREKVLKDSQQEPAIKVALRNMKDFAWPLQVTVNNNKEIFWKWYLLPNEEASKTIRNILGVQNKKIETESKKVIEAKEEVKEQPKAEEKKIEVKYEEPNFTEQKPEIKEEKKIEEKKTETKEEHKPQIPEKKPAEQPKPAGEFLWQTLTFFTQNNIKVLNKEVIRKNEIDFIVELQSAVGGLKYYCKTKQKQKINDADLSTAYVQGELRKMPVIFLTKGEPTKRAKEMMAKEFKNIIFKKI